eukprot:m.11837 g.11837  ORF g.11837 m.11837 type:complete len:448 (+) comp4532_c0_seq2:77-1420(+)
MRTVQLWFLWAVCLLPLQLVVASEESEIQTMRKEIEELKRLVQSDHRNPGGNSWGYINVMDPPYNAAGDGVTDDTAAFQKALNSSSGIVFAPTGTYAIKGYLEVPTGVVLKGSNEYPFRSYGTPNGKVQGTTLLAYVGEGNMTGLPFIFLNGANSGVTGLNVFYPNQNLNAKVPTPYSPTIQGSGDDVTVKNVFLVNPYIGVDFATYPCGRHLIDGLYGQPLYKGIRIDQCYDIGRIKTVHFWPFWAPLNSGPCNWQHTNAISFEILRTDWEVVEDVFSFGYHTGMKFANSSQGSCNGQFTDINFDDVDIGLDISYSQNPAIIFSNLNVANAGDGLFKIGIRGTAGKANVVIRGASFWGAIKQAIVWNNGGHINIFDSSFNSWSGSLPAIDILLGRAMISGNYFTDIIGTAIHIGPETDRALITGNELVGNKIHSEINDTMIGNNHY